MALPESVVAFCIIVFTAFTLIGAVGYAISEERRKIERYTHERERELLAFLQTMPVDEKPKHAETRQHQITQILSDDGELIDVHLFYSPEDNGWIANIPSLQYCSAFGETPEAAMREIKIAAHAWLASAEQHGILRSNN